MRCSVALAMTVLDVLGDNKPYRHCEGLQPYADGAFQPEAIQR